MPLFVTLNGERARPFRVILSGAAGFLPVILSGAAAQLPFRVILSGAAAQLPFRVILSGAKRSRRISMIIMTIFV